MSINNFVRGWKAFVGRMNEKGVPMPMARYQGKGSPALTLVILSSSLVIVGIVGKWAGHLGGIDMASAMQFFYASCTLFFGHSWVHKETIGADGKTQELDLKTGDTDQK